MKWKWAFFLLFLLGILVPPCVWISKSFRKEVPPQKTQHLKCIYGSYFIPISISKFTAANQPCISAKINDQTISLMLDLGLRGQFSFSSQFLSGIENKTYLRSKKMYGIRGIEYEEKIFEIPEITIGSMIFSHPNIHECAERFHADATLMKKDNELSTPEPGKAGWELFGNINLFLDLRNSKIAFCDSLSTLENHGYKIANFTKTPLLLQRGLVEFETETPQGCLRCMLDTGATWNILNTEVEEGKSIEQVVHESSNILEYLSFKIGTQDFGPIAFHCIPIKIPIHIEAILGMEFLEDHLVFLDFADNHAYFLKEAVQP